ncbi:hypothetical protein ABIF38_005034 [Bradyrhizobium japonicum]|nr:hypothetical protein [Bradyrhizobium elkanii]MCP1732653.1 hypothetical protein [Bradyrhizobium elkanii]MCS3567991.1 hypothetical protein [Bradyrhizobium elkanii]MCS3590526.1 hypothetical protein [Bradyrhizobium elkanii]MCS3619969.1 hypothetical protein [Bradyrhizobium elkanii]MCW2111777.1 hypothetical protein [Bradyrhizobium elkanii]
MSALQAKLERFETFAAECETIADRALDRSNRELYRRLAARYRELATDMRTVIATVDAAA